MTDINNVVDAVKHLNQVWKSCNGKNTANWRVSKEAYDILFDVDLAIANLIDKVGEAVKAITVNSIYK